METWQPVSSWIIGPDRLLSRRRPFFYIMDFETSSGEDSVLLLRLLRDPVNAGVTVLASPLSMIAVEYYFL